MSRRGERGRSLRGARRLPILAAVLLGAVLSAPASAAIDPAPEVHAHRGGPLTSKSGTLEPAHVEEGIAAYRAAARRGFVLEVDAKLSSDRVPIAIHDATLERTTDCEGEVASMTAADLRRDCEIDLLGTDETTRQLDAGDPRREPVPTVAEVLRLADRKGVKVNLEVKNVPTDPDFEPAARPQFALDVAAVVKESKLPPERLIVQSFFPPNLEVFEEDPYFAEASTSLLTVAAANAGGPAAAAEAGYEFVSPAWPVDETYVERAHGLGVKVVPYTIDDADGIRAAAAVDVDAVISNDPLMARDALRRPGDCANVRVGTGAADFLRGYGAGEKLRSRGGDDKVKGRGGADCIGGGPGDDRVVGGPGPDRIRCGRGDDTAVADRRDRVADSCEKVR